MARELAQKLSCGLVPKAYGRVFGAGYNVLGVEAHVEHTGGVMAEATDGPVASSEIPHNTRAVRGAGDHHGCVILQAKNRAAMVEVRCITCRRRGSLGGDEFGKGAMAAAGHIGGKRVDS